MKKISTILLTFCIASMLVFGQSVDNSLEYDTGNADPIINSTEKLFSLTENTLNLNEGTVVSGSTIENPSENSNYNVVRGERPPIDIMAAPEEAYEKGILKIKFKESLTTQLDESPVLVTDNGNVVFNITSVDQLNEQYQPTNVKKLFGVENPSSKFFDRHRAWGFHLWYTLYFDEDTDIKELVLVYESLDEVALAEPQYKTTLHSSVPITYQFIPNEDGSKSNSSDAAAGQGPPPVDWTPNDPGYSLQWHYHNTGQFSGTVDADIDLPEAWDIEKGNSNVIVSIHDQGIQYDHPDLAGNMWKNIAEYYGIAGVDDDANGYIDDIYGWDFYNDNASIEGGYHGTHVAGTVAAETNNGIGVSGIAGGSGSNDGVRLMSCMVYLASGGSGNGHHLAPVYAADNGACIDQNSWGYTSAGYYDQAVLDAIDYFNTNGGGSALSAGITIYAAGNSYSEGLYYPGCYSGTFAVAATDNHDEKAPYSTYGTWVDVSAPGGDNSVMDERAVYSTFTPSTYDYIDGTSMACPHVSGTAALMVSMAYGQLTPTDVADILRNTTDDIDALNPTYVGKIGTGRINAYQALLETQTYMTTPGTLMPLPEHTSTFTGNVRGYWFTAPTSFVVTGLRVPNDVVGDQTIEIIRFNSGPPPTWSGTTNDFVSLGRWVSVSGSAIIECNIPVSAGDYIGILGCRGTTTSYGPNNYATTINGNAVTLTRLGMQYQLPTNVAQDVFQEPTGSSLGRIEMYYESLPGIWTGTVNHSWNNAGNWSDGTIPDASTNVTIPAGTPNDCWVASNDGFCNNLTIESGASLRIYDEVLTVSGSMYIHGLLKMEEYIDNGELHIAGNIVWESGSSAIILSNTLNMFISGNWNFEDGANVQLDQGYVTFEGAGNQWIRSYDEDCYFNNIRNENTGTYGLAVSEFSTKDLYINGNIYNYSGHLFRFRSDHSIIVDGFFNNLGGNFEGQFGTFVFNGSAAIGLKPNAGNYFNNLTISTNSVLSLDNTYSNILTVNGNLLIDGGGINANNFTLEVAGTWTNNVGTGGFDEGTSTVRLIKPDAGVQMINSDEHFNILECATEPTTGIRTAGGATVTCNVYDWTSGSISAIGSTFEAFDIADNGLYGRIFALTNSEIIFHQTSGYVDLFCTEVFINNGLVQVIGGNDESYWCSSADLDLTIENGGVFDFDGYGITVFDNYLLNEDITNGTIKTSGWFTCNRTDFNPAGGNFEFYGGTDSRINLLAGSTFHNLEINKSGGDKSFFQIKDRDGEVIESAKSNTALLYSNVVVDNEVIVTDGELTLNGYQLTVTHDCNVNGILSMTNAADVLNVGTNYFDYLYFNSGSTGNFNEGIVNIYGWIRPNAGSTFNAATSNTVYFKGENGGGPWNNEPSATFGNMIVDKDPGARTYVALSATQPVVLLGDLTINPNNEFELQDHSVTVHGFLTDDMSSEIYLWNASKKGSAITDEAKGIESSGDSKASGSKGGYFEIDNDFTLNGLLDVADGDVLLHGNFGIAATGILNITTGSLVADQAYAADKAWQYLYGTINLTDGLFEISHNSMQFGTTSVNNISGGIMRCGFSFSALFAGTFQPSAGIVEFTGTGNNPRIELEASNYFHNILIARSESIHLANDIYVQNNLQIDSGPLFAYNYVSTPFDIYVGGNWTNNGGDAAFDESTGTVIFNGTGDVAINSSETFYNLTLDKVNAADWLNLYGDVTVSGDLTINPGALYSNANTLNVYGNATVNAGGVLYMEANSTLALDAGSQLTVNTGSTMYTVGSAGNEPLITHISTGTYNFSVFGTIGAHYAIFEYMNASGINVKNVGNVALAFPFNYCTFRNGAPAPSALLVLNNDQEFTSTNVYFENTIGNTGYNVWKFYDTGNVTFENATGDFAGPEFEYDPNTRIHWGDMDVELDLSVMIEGAYIAGTMSTILRDMGLIPLDQPFDSNPNAMWYYTGTESVASIPPNVVDWVLVQIRDAADAASATSGTIISTQAAFLLNDGSVVGLDGSSNLYFTGIDYGTGLFPVIWHRNHVGVISSDIIPRVEGIHTWDFTLAGSAYSNTNPGHKNLGSGIYGMYSGDASGGGWINDFDLTFWYQDAGLKGYLQSDHDLNGQCDNIDKNDHWYTNYNIITQIPFSKNDDN